MARAKRVYLSEGQKKEITRMNREGWSTKQIIEKLKVPKYGTYNFIRRMGLKSNGNRIFSPKDIKLMKTLYLSGRTIDYIYNNYFKGVCKSNGAINYTLKELGITRRNGCQAIIKHDYFNVIDTEEKAYFIGLLLADGSVRHNKEKGESYSLRLELKVEDKYIIERLTRALGSDNPVKECKTNKRRGEFKMKHNAYNAFNSKQLFDDLGEYEIVPNKSLTLKNLPNIDRKLMRHFIRGFFDGDGTVYITKKNNKLHFGFYGTYVFIGKLKKYLEKELNLPNNKIIKQKNANVSFVTYSKQTDVANFYKYIYKDATIYLTRKKEVFEKILL